MTNEEKVDQIIEGLSLYDINSDNCEHHDCYTHCYLSAMEMAEWKDAQFEKILDYIEICYGVFQYNTRESFIKKIKELYYGQSVRPVKNKQ